MSHLSGSLYAHGAFVLLLCITYVMLRYLLGPDTPHWLSIRDCNGLGIQLWVAGMENTNGTMSTEVRASARAGSDECFIFKR